MLYSSLLRVIRYRLDELKTSAFYNAYFAPWTEENKGIKITYIVCMPVLYVCLAWNYSIIDQKGLIAVLLGTEVLATLWFGEYVRILEDCSKLVHRTLIEGGPDTVERARKFRYLRRCLTRYSYSSAALKFLPISVFISLCGAIPDETHTREYITAYVLAFLHTLGLALWNINIIVQDIYDSIKSRSNPTTHVDDEGNVRTTIRVNSDDYILISMKMIEKDMYKNLDKNP